MKGAKICFGGCAAAGLCLSSVKSGTAIIPRASSSPPAITGPATPDALSTTSSSGGGGAPPIWICL